MRRSWRRIRVRVYQSGVLVTPLSWRYVPRPMRVERIGELTVRITGGVDREGGGTGPLVVLLHGYGAPGTDLVGLWRELRVPREVRFAFPEAPLALDLGMPGFEGRAWWNLDLPELERAFATGRHDA